MPAPTLPAGILPASGVYLSDFLVESVKRRTRMPISQATLDTWDVLRIADEQIQSYVAPLMISEGEDYLTAGFDTPITASASYPLPARAMKDREVQFLAAGATTPVDVPRIAIESLPYAAWGFYFLGNTLKLVNPGQFVGYTIRRTVYLRPSKLIEAAAAGVLASLDRNTGAITLAEAAPDELAATESVDLIRGTAPFEVVALDVPASVSGSVVTVDPSEIPAGWGSPGDFICRPQECPGVQVHPDLFSLVAQAVAVAILDGNGDDAAYARADRELQKLDKAARDLLAQRVEGEPVPIGGGFSPIWDRSWRNQGGWGWR